MLKTWIVAVAMLIVSGCAMLDTLGNDSRIPVQYATMKVIESSDNITAKDVLEHTERVRSIIDKQVVVDVGSLVDQTLERIALDSLAPSDQLLIRTLFTQIEYSFDDLGPTVSPEARLVRLVTVLDWIDQAARLSE